MTAVDIVAGPFLPATPADPLTVLLEAWLLSFESEHTRRAYRDDIAGTSTHRRVPSWFVFCETIGVHPLQARRPHIDLWARDLDTTGLKPRTRARKLACIASFYKYCVWEDVLADSPVEHVRRPKIGDRGETPGLNQDELVALLHAATASGSARSVALVRLLAYSGLRINEALSRDVEHLGHDRGHMTLSIVRKGGASDKVVLSAPTQRALTRYLDGRTTGPIFITQTGQRMRQTEAWRMVRRLARRAALQSAGALSPHSLRVAFITSAREANVPLEDVQDQVGHKDPRTTRRYDRGRHSLDRSPVYAVTSWLGDEED